MDVSLWKSDLDVPLSEQTINGEADVAPSSIITVNGRPVAQPEYQCAISVIKEYYIGLGYSVHILRLLRYF